MYILRFVFIKMNLMINLSCFINSLKDKPTLLYRTKSALANQSPIFHNNYEETIEASFRSQVKFI